MRFQVSGACALVLFALSGCQNNGVKTAAADVAAGVSNSLISVRESAQKFAVAAEHVYSHLDQYDLSTKGMDVKDGGIFDTFQNNTYYYKTKHEGASYYVSPMKPVNDVVRRAVKTMQYLEGDIQSSYEKNGDIMALAFFGVHQPQSVGILYPWVDVVSFLPPQLEIKAMEWYTRGLASNGEAKWSNGPFVSFYAGWIEDVAVPVRVDGAVTGVIVLAISLEKLKAKYFANRTENLLLLGPDLTVFVATPSARKALPIQVVEAFDYTKQLKMNTSPSEGYRLSDNTQPAGMADVARAIAAGQTTVEKRLGGKDWTFYSEEVKETHFYVVGFSPR